MRRKNADFVSPEAAAAARHLGVLVKQARLARRWSQAALSERARISKPTLVRLEKGAIEASLAAWLAVFDALGMLQAFQDIADPVSQSLLRQTQTQRARAPSTSDLDF